MGKDGKRWRSGTTASARNCAEMSIGTWQAGESSAASSSGVLTLEPLPNSTTLAQPASSAIATAQRSRIQVSVCVG
jgi:hypothetical protein